MSSAILIAYATRSGSTGEVAHAMAASLSDAGWLAEALPMQQVESLEGRTTVILGAPLYVGKFPMEFHSFLARHRAALGTLRPWLFVLGPTRDVPADFDAARQQAEKQLLRYPWLHTAAMQVFGGKFDIDSLPFPFSLARRLPRFLRKEMPVTDIRAWAAIRKWALSVANQIKPAA